MPGYPVACTDLGANETHVPRGHVFEWGTSLKMVRWRTWGVWHKNGTIQEHQMSAVGKWMSPASRTRGHVAHVLLHVRPQGVIFVLNVINT